MSPALRTLWYLHQLRRSQWWRQDQLRKLQAKKLHAIVQHAYAAVEFYHARFRALGLRPDDLRTVSDLSKLPVTTRSDVIKHFPAGIVARGTDVHACLHRRTSGSTGTPVEVVFNEDDQAFRHAVFYRAMFACGLRLRDKLATGSLYPEGPATWFQQLGLLRRRNIHPQTPVAETLAMLRAYQPDGIYFFASYLHNLAQTIDAEGLRELHPRLVFSHGELLDANTRELVNTVFQTQMFDTYGSSEFIRLAWECPAHGGLHMDVDGYVVEFLEDGEPVSPGERGEIFVTSLNATAMPLLRYPIGDYGVPLDDACACGRGLPLMQHLEGRADDFLLLPDGQLVAPRRLAVTLWETPGVGGFRVIQPAIDRLVVEFTPGRGYSEDTRRTIVEAIHATYGQDLQVEALVVETLPTDRSGKLQKVISEVSKAAALGEEDL
jgi:phenylacetate-CoA ligase